MQTSSGTPAMNLPSIYLQVISPDAIQERSGSFLGVFKGVIAWSWAVGDIDTHDIGRDIQDLIPASVNKFLEES